MKIFINFTTENQYGSFAKSPLRYFHLYLSDLLSDIKSPVKSLEINFAYASKNQNENSERFLEWYNSLPYARFTKKSGLFSVTIPFPELYEYQENIENYPIFPPLFERLREAINLIDKKMQKNGISLKEPIEPILNKTEREISKENLERIHKLYELKCRQDCISKNLADRERRKNANEKANKLIYDIRFYCRVEGMSNLDFSPHHIDICNKILKSLRAEKFKLPNFTHLYLCVSDSFENALYHSTRFYNWFVYGIALLKNPRQYAIKNESEKKQIVFELIKEALFDIAKIDKLDIEVLNKTLDKIKKEL
jgi:hypothetical protein